MPIDSGQIFAVWTNMPEYREHANAIYSAWLLRVFLAAGGLLVVYIAWRTRGAGGNDEPRVSEFREPSLGDRTWRSFVCRLGFGVLASSALWVGLDLMTGEMFVLYALSSIPPTFENESKALLILCVGWVAVVFASSELIRLAIRKRA